ncbi:MAG: pyruvate:ferredoxin (flavodoxin) oxidoreductase [Candidatus Latescibacteria bacterium]|nr:pyruvate:ferredoxin (flavodoxin) oxidoreductase [Candidatus Latescibacterota bacterium]NIM21990.1 pyruvate:ferredoxin (flavodoxin) oxidoreductase [Candidatus Latescibacterota bacterium]NIM66008.1 pyruvate:ferredoxin (flavodoxin) oxidoreductase [Candidatus Latescibacterota bacterium]NIO02416.1 pyruvate:ferredoxin (flavodoxin) oxidoreductase [Candidatus Latescibacterota bacterium]NIO29327.1 pyruvate:ferredoxin (flavodoxin) oxidoreductase [Candidatus Latescibacterota bacterium]
MRRKRVTIDGNEAAAYVAHKTNEVIAIYPITPSSPMGELSDAWSSGGRPNIWGTIPHVVEMQSEGGASGAVHGALQTGALTTTFTSSQGLLLMIPNMFKIAGELTPTVFHIAARTVATHALSIFGDHSDVMAARTTGFAFLASASIQEVMDFALIAQAASLEARVPFLHFFDGFRMSHETSKIEQLSDEDMLAMLDEELIMSHRARALSPDHPVLRGSAQNPDVFFQARETVNPYYAACADIVQKVMDKFARVVGREYKLFDYFGAPDAERVIAIMTSGGEAVHEAVNDLVDRGEKVGVVKVRLYRPFSTHHFLSAIPKSVRVIAALDRTKEPGSAGEPLYMDVVNAFVEGGAEAGFKTAPRIIGGRYGLSSKEFTSAMAKGVFDEMKKESPKNHFTIGIEDDATGTSLDYDPDYSTEADDVIRSVFYGLGSDGTVSANKNSIKIIGEGTDNFAQGYFVYDSRKAGSVTISHLRFGPRLIRSTYLVSKANFVGCHQFVFLEKYDVLEPLVEGGTFLLNSPHGPDEVWDRLPRQVQEQMIEKKVRFFVIDAYKIARETGMGVIINTIMQTCFFAISGVLPKDEAIAAIKDSILKTYGGKGEDIVNMNFNSVDRALENLHEVPYPDKATSKIEIPPTVPEEAPDFVREVTARIIAGKGDDIPVSKMPIDGTFPLGTTKWEKRNIALEIPVWDEKVCIQCGKCSMVCPHGTIRFKVYDSKCLDGAPATFKSTDARDKEWKGLKYTLQVAPEDCTGCGLCVDVCPAKNKAETRLKAINMQPQAQLREPESENWEFFLELPEMDRNNVKMNVRQSQVFEPLFEFSGACAGCGETPYVKLLTQLFGDRAIIANATGCSSIYGGNLPATPYAANKEGRGPAWSNSLFEDNAEFGFGFRLAIDKHAEFATELAKKLKSELGSELVDGLVNAEQKDEAGIYEQRQRVAKLKEKLKTIDSREARQLESVADMLLKKSVWVLGGDGWAFDIGFGGLDHVLASGRNVNVLVLDTGVYSNTGGQMSKATPRAAVAKFAAGGKPTPRKDLGMIAMTYGSVYVAQVAMGAKDEHTLKAFLEAEAYDGPSLIIAYSHCIAHGINMTMGMHNQKAAVQSGAWPLYRYNPDLAAEGKNPLVLDSAAPKIPLEEYMYRENRFKMLTKSNPREAKRLLKIAKQEVMARWKLYEHMASMTYGSDSDQDGG